MITTLASWKPNPEPSVCWKEREREREVGYLLLALVVQLGQDTRRQVIAVPLFR